MPKKGYKHPGKNVICGHCNSPVSALLMDRAWLVAEILQSQEDVTIDVLEDELDLTRELVNQALRMYRDHLAGLVGEGIICIRTPAGWIYRLTHEWQNDDGTDVEAYDRLMNRRILTEMTHVRDLTAISHARMDGRRRRLKLDVGQMLSQMNAMVEQQEIIRQRLLILDEELEQAS